DDRSAGGNLATVLLRLGLPADPAAPPAEQLEGALEAWDPARVPRTDAAAPPDDGDAPGVC
ncbi:MAG: hypothetical protein V2J02_21470, partial [Pseudomonadales bacterium]|nr:hypothetical protein [Pseudomonadales bacterium]